MSKITANVELFSVQPFERVNTHVNLQWPEKFVAITLKGDDGIFYVNFTRKHSGFAEAIAELHIGDCLTVTGNFKREQDHANLGGQIVLTNCVIGTPKVDVAAQKREAKKLARLAKLYG